MTLKLQHNAVASAGPDIDPACQLTPYTITGAWASNYTSLIWTDNGLGTLMDATTLTPDLYTFSQ